MLDIVLLTKALLTGALASAAVLWLAARGAPRPWRRSASWSWAIGAGLIAASAASDQWPHWPPLEDRARFLTLLVPLTLAVETFAAWQSSGRMAWALRLALAAVVAPVLLHDTVYLANHDGVEALWSPALATLILCSLAALLALVWWSLARLRARTSAPTILGILLLDALAAAFTVMLSGYYRAGLLGLGLAGALAGAAFVSCFFRPSAPTQGSLGASVIGLFSVVLMGRYFGSLSTDLAGCLLLAPLPAWIVELSPLRKLSPRLRDAARLACVALPLVLVIVVAQQRFAASSKAPSRPSAPSTTRQSLEK